MKKCDELADWYAEPLGEAFALLEADCLEQVLPGLFGYTALQIGSSFQKFWLQSSAIPHKIFLDCSFQKQDTHSKVISSALVCEYECLPFPSESLDLVFLPHTLEFCSDPFALLKEVARVLIPEGHIIIFGFNPFSLWGIWKFFAKKKTSFPWNITPMSFFQLKRALAEESFHICYHEALFYRPPINNYRWLKKLLFLETLGRLCWPYPGSVQFMVARRKVAALTPLQFSKGERLDFRVKDRCVQPTSFQQDIKLKHHK